MRLKTLKLITASVVLVDLSEMIDKEVNAETITFNNDTEPFAELPGKQAFVLDREDLANALYIYIGYIFLLLGN